MTDEAITWQKVLEPEELPEGRVKTAACGHRMLCMTHFEGQYGALDNRCPHQGGPLGEGSIENGLLRCPWHGWDYHPITGAVPGFDDKVETFPVDVREDGVANSVDASLILQLKAGLISSLPNESSGDVNGDGALTSVDAALLLQFTAGLIGEDALTC